MDLKYFDSGFFVSCKESQLQFESVLKEKCICNLGKFDSKLKYHWRTQQIFVTLCFQTKTLVKRAWLNGSGGTFLHLFSEEKGQVLNSIEKHTFNHSLLDILDFYAQ